MTSDGGGMPPSAPVREAGEAAVAEIQGHLLFAKAL